MAAKIAALLITLLLGIALGVVVLAFMIVAMNGYSERDAAWGIGVFAGLALIIASVTSVLAFFFAGTLIKKEFSPLLAASIPIPVFTTAALILEIFACLIGIGVAEFVRVNY